jgi:hypothetical protein
MYYVARQCRPRSIHFVFSENQWICRKNFRDYPYGPVARDVHIMCGLPSMWFLGASMTWIATPCDYRSIS